MGAAEPGRVRRARRRGPSGRAAPGGSLGVGVGEELVQRVEAGREGRAIGGGQRPERRGEYRDPAPPPLGQYLPALRGRPDGDAAGVGTLPAAHDEAGALQPGHGRADRGRADPLRASQRGHRERAAVDDHGQRGQAGRRQARARVDGGDPAQQVDGGGVQPVGALDLAEAAALDYAARVAELIEGGAAADTRTPDGYTPLQLAAFFGAPAAAALLLQRGADPGAVADNPMRVQPLHAAVAGRHHEIAAQLVAAGVDVDARQQGGYTPLLAAAGSGDTALVRLLVDAGADPGLADDQGVRPAELAAQHGHDGLADELRAATVPR